jgi:phage-related holin
LSSQEICKIVIELGPEHIVQIVTDNGSDYKKAYKMITHKFLIVWQSCLAHMINLMLKAVGEFLKHKVVILIGRRICRWLYNHNKLHAMMRAAIGGELVKWNATQFGTNYMFLERMQVRLISVHA